MTHQPQYTTIASEAFGNFLDNKIDLDTLIERLRDIELQIISEEEEETDKGLWFRFFEGDTLQTSITEIENDLSDPSHPNSQILLRGIAYGLEAKELEVHLS